MVNPTWYQGPGDYLNVSITPDNVNQVKVLQANLLQVNGVYPNLPGNIFVYQNTGTITLGTYIGVANLDELTRFQIFNPNTPIPIMGNKYILYNTAKITLGLSQDPTTYITNISTGIKNLNAQYKLITASSITYLPK